VTRKYLVETTASAEADIRSIKQHIAADNPKAATRWTAEIERTIQRFERMPLAYEVIPEASDLGVDYRQKLFGKYRVIYRVEGQRVIVLRIIHGARLLDQSMFMD
jgi:plasmid stabilization system protein ParE